MKSLKVFFFSLCCVVCLSSCVGTKHITITSTPNSANIYVDGVFQGTGYVQYDIPKNQKYIDISCGEDGIILAQRRFNVRSMSHHIDFSITEYMRYSSTDTPTFN